MSNKDVLGKISGITNTTSITGTGGDKRNKKLIIVIISLSVLLVAMLALYFLKKPEQEIVIKDIPGRIEYDKATIYLKERKYDDALRYYKESAKLGYELANVALATMYYKGEGVRKDACQTKSYVENICHNAKAENAKKGACRIMATLYINGECVSSNTAKAREYLEMTK